MRLQVLGPGCANCARLAAHVERAAREVGVDFTLEKVTDLEAIVRAGVLRTPALAIDGTVRFSGRVPGVEELKALLAEVPTTR